MKELYKISGALTNENIKNIMAEFPPVYFDALGKKAIEKTKFLVALEELLLRFRNYYGTEKSCDVILSKNFGNYSIEIATQGERKDYFPGDEDIKLSFDILSRLGVEPRYAYSPGRVGKNRLIWQSVAQAKKHSAAFSIIIAVILAVIAGILINLLPSSTQSMLTEEIITPVFSKMTMIISALATPLVFFAVIGGIVDIGDVRAFGKIGSRLLTRMAGSYLIAGLFATVGCRLIFGISDKIAPTNGDSAFGSVVKLVLDIIPDNLLAPFTIDNDLQVIVIAVFVGITILILGNQLPRVNEVVKEGALLINKMMTICCKLLPLVVFFGVTNLLATSNAEQFISIGKMLAGYLAINLVFLLFMAIRARLVTGVPLKYIIPKQLATLMINITTASQVAALPENMKCCKEKFGIDSKLIDFAVPLGIVIYMPSGAMFLIVTAIGLMEIAGVPITLGILIQTAFIAIVIAIAAPPIPGSALVVFPVLFAACGIPNEVYPLAIIFGTLLTNVFPASNGYNIQLELLMTAKKLKKMDDRLYTESRKPMKQS